MMRVNTGYRYRSLFICSRQYFVSVFFSLFNDAHSRFLLKVISVERFKFENS